MTYTVVISLVMSDEFIATYGTGGFEMPFPKQTIYQINECLDALLDLLFVSYPDINRHIINISINATDEG